jgi:hypothetical protein
MAGMKEGQVAAAGVAVVLQLGISLVFALVSG